LFEIRKHRKLMHYCYKNKYLNMEIYAQNIENKYGEVQLFSLQRSGE